VDEGLAVIDAVRARFDGYRHNPWNEQECGHHYARAMASWAAVLALGGFHYSAVAGRLELAPRWKPEAFRSVWTLPCGWGLVSQAIAGSTQLVVWEVLSGELSTRTMRYALPQEAEPRAVTCEVAGESHEPHVSRQGQAVDIHLPRAVTIAEGEVLRVHVELA